MPIELKLEKNLGVAAIAQCVMVDVSLKFDESCAAFQAKPSDLDDLASSTHQYSHWQSEGNKLYNQGQYEESINKST